MATTGYLAIPGYAAMPASFEASTRQTLPRLRKSVADTRGNVVGNIK
jgi:hypothetical protein